METSEPQGVLTGLPATAIYLTVTLLDGGEGSVLDLLADLGGLRRSVGFRAPDDGLSCVVGIGSEAWDRLFPGGPRPADLHPFPGFEGATHTAPATPGDLLFHIRARRLDLCFELAQRIAGRLDGAARIVDEVHGFRYFDERDLLGFVDGTENPEGRGAWDAVTVTAEEDSTFAGGSYVITQKYVHDLGAWNALTVEAQEQAIGRTKLEDVELADDVKPSNSHVALNTIVDEDGEEQDIVRFNMPFGAVGTGEFGTYFIGYARDPGVIEQMLTNMFVGKPVGNHDRILDFSTALTGNLYFVPTVEVLEDPGSIQPPADGDAATEAAPADDAGEASTSDAPASDPADGSLGIGGLTSR